MPHSSLPSCLVMYLERVLKLASHYIQRVSKLPFGTLCSARANPCPTCFRLLWPLCITQAFQAAQSCIFKGFRNCRLALLVLLGPTRLGPPCPTRAFQAARSCIFNGFRNCRLALLVLLGPTLAPLASACECLRASLEPSKLPDHASLKVLKLPFWHFWFC